MISERNDKGQIVRVHHPWSLENFDDGYVDRDGRMRVYAPWHPRADSAGRVPRSIIAYETYHDVSIPEKRNLYEIHHKDGNRLNDSKENLICLTHGDHQKVHSHLRGQIDTFVCKNCGKDFQLPSFRKRGDRSRGKYCSPECYHSSKQGVRHHNAIFTEEQVIEIYADTEHTQAELMEIYGCSRTAIQGIHQGISYLPITSKLPGRK